MNENEQLTSSEYRRTVPTCRPVFRFGFAPDPSRITRSETPDLPTRSRLTMAALLCFLAAGMLFLTLAMETGAKAPAPFDGLSIALQLNDHGPGSDEDIGVRNPDVGYLGLCRRRAAAKPSRANPPGAVLARSLGVIRQRLYGCMWYGLERI